MLTISNPPVGALAYGRSGKPAVIEALEADRVLLRTPNGLKRVPLEAVVRWELPALPKIPTPGQRVRLKRTQLEYMLIETYSVRCGLDADGSPSFEQWAKLQNEVSTVASWKLQQLEVIA